MLDCSLYLLMPAIVGCVVIFFFILNTFWSLLQATRAILAPYFLPNEETSLAKKYGSWALITGSTDGIGKAYAHELAKRGINIILVSRSEEKLKKTAQEIEQIHSVKTKIIVTDFSHGPKAIETIKNQIDFIEVGILINNVGKMYDYPMYFCEVSEKDLWDIITINVGAATLLSRLVIEKMRIKKKGAVVNISSGSELQPLPLMTVYAATKVYLKSFTAALRYEYSKSGITIQHLAPMFINTKMNVFCERLQTNSTFVPSAEMYAKYAVATLGKMDESSGYWSHEIQTFLTTIAPVWMRTQIGGFLNRKFRNEYLAAKAKTS